MLALAHSRELIDLPEENIRSIKVPVCGVAGEKDSEKKYLERMQGVLDDYELTMVPNAGHDRAGASQVFKDTLIGFMEKNRGS